MKNTLLFALLGALHLAVDGHFISYEDSSEADSGYFTPSYYVTKSPPGKHGYSGRSDVWSPSYYVSKTLPYNPDLPHGTGPIYDYPAAPRRPLSIHGRGRSDFYDVESYEVDSVESEPELYHIYRSGRSKGKKSGHPIKGGWWYKIVKGKLITGRWGAPPPPGLEKEHYKFGGYGGGWGHQQQSYGWGQPQHGWGKPQQHGWGKPQGWGWGKPQQHGWGGGHGGGYGGGYGYE